MDVGRDETAFEALTTQFGHDFQSTHQPSYPEMLLLRMYVLYCIIVIPHTGPGVRCQLCHDESLGVAYSGYHMYATLVTCPSSRTLVASDGILRMSRHKGHGA